MYYYLVINYHNPAALSTITWSYKVESISCEAENDADNHYSSVPSLTCVPHVERRIFTDSLTLGFVRDIRTHVSQSTLLG